MIQLPHIKARIERLKRLTNGLAKEVNAQKDAKGLLLSLERKKYVDGMTDALGRLDDARVVLEGVVERMQQEQA
jgi:hypothetical protein